MVHQTFADSGPALSTNSSDFLRVTPTVNPVPDKQSDFTIRSPPLVRIGARSHVPRSALALFEFYEAWPPQLDIPTRLEWFWDSASYTRTSHPGYHPTSRRPPTPQDADCPTGHVTREKRRKRFGLFWVISGVHLAPQHLWCDRCRENTGSRPVLEP